MTNDCEELTVHALGISEHMGPAFYTSLPSGSSDAEALKHLLVSSLWDHLEVIESPVWKRFQSSGIADFPLQLVRGRFGRPHLLLGERRGPAISFSTGGGKVWAALCGDGSDIGIDVAESDEFHRPYPVHRVFHPDELKYALRLAEEDLESASALLWSVKEAVVKALGCAFHLVNPRQLTVYPSEDSEAEWNGGYTLRVGLSGKALVRFPLATGRSLCVRAFPQQKMWLSIALLDRGITGL